MTTSNNHYIICTRRGQYRGVRRLKVRQERMRYLVRSLTVAKALADEVAIDRTWGL